jgi:hypothetical protein
MSKEFTPKPPEGGFNTIVYIAIKSPYRGLRDYHANYFEL